MPTVERSIVINRPVEEVFDFVADGRNEPQYNPDSLRAELLAGAGPGPGARYRSEGRMLGRRMVVVKLPRLCGEFSTGSPSVRS